MTQFSVENPTDNINTITFITQYLCIPIVSFFVLMRFGIRTWYKQPFTVEDGKLTLQLVSRVRLTL